VTDFQCPLPQAFRGGVHCSGINHDFCPFSGAGALAVVPYTEDETFTAPSAKIFLVVAVVPPGGQLWEPIPPRVPVLERLKRWLVG
jgi:hypothetical protein